jgi:hypothetical protein
MRELVALAEGALARTREDSAALLGERNGLLEAQPPLWGCPAHILCSP